jgi:hypothetical protein
MTDVASLASTIKRFNDLQIGAHNVTSQLQQRMKVQSPQERDKMQQQTQWMQQQHSEGTQYRMDMASQIVPAQQRLVSYDQGAAWGPGNVTHPQVDQRQFIQAQTLHDEQLERQRLQRQVRQPDTGLQQLIYHKFNEQTGPFSGWQANVLVQERIGYVSDM